MCPPKVLLAPLVEHTNQNCDEPQNLHLAAHLRHPNYNKNDSLNKIFAMEYNQ